MTALLRRNCGAALAYAVTTQAAFADVTASDVWAYWQTYFGGMGNELSGDQSTSGEVTTITNMTMVLPEVDHKLNLAVPELTLTRNGDGTVSIGFPDNFPVIVSGESEGKTFSADLEYTHDALNVVASGTPENMTYDYTVNSQALVLKSMEFDGETVPSENLGFSFQLNEVAGTSQMNIGENLKIAEQFTAGTLTYDIAFHEPDRGWISRPDPKDTGRISGKLTDLAFDSDTLIPADVDVTNLAEFYEAGFSTSGTFSYGSGNTEVAGTTEGKLFSVSSSSEGGRFTVSLDAQRFMSNLTQNSTNLAILTAGLPPFEIAMANAGLKFEFPVQASDEIRPFDFGMNLTDFTISDLLWRMLDPAGSLPRDPATITLETTGTTKVLIDFMDPEALEDLETSDVVPAELHSLKFNELLVSLVGAKLTGDGNFKFDNSNTAEFDGLPTPSGIAKLKLVGANSLIDRLIGLGIVSEVDVIGARMMMGLMAVPGENPDILNSTIEFTENGHILVNGQRIK